MKSKHYRLVRFSLRSLCVLFTVMLVCLGFTANHVGRERAAIRAITELGGRVFYRRPDLDFEGSGFAATDIHFKDPSGPTWLRLFVGTTMLCDSTQVWLPAGASVSLERMRDVCRLPNVTRVDVTKATIDDEVLHIIQSEYPKIEFAH